MLKCCYPTIQVTGASSPKCPKSKNHISVQDDIDDNWYHRNTFPKFYKLRWNRLCPLFKITVKIWKHQCCWVCTATSRRLNSEILGLKGYWNCSCRRS